MSLQHTLPVEFFLTLFLLLAYGRFNYMETAMTHFKFQDVDEKSVYAPLDDYCLETINM